MSLKNLIFFLPNFGEGGASDSIRRIVLNLDQKNYKIYIVCLGKCIYKKQFEKKGINVIELNSKKTIFCFFELKKKVFDSFELQSKNTLFISNMNYANVLSIIFVKFLLLYKVVVIERTSLNELDNFFGFIDYSKKKIIKFLMFSLYRFADKVIANSKKTSDDLRALTNCNPTYIYPGTIYRILPFKKKRKSKKYSFLSFGRLSKEKNFSLLIKAVSQIRSKNFSLTILGNGELRNKLLNEIDHYKLRKIIKIINYKKNSKKYFLKSDLFISTSFFEGFPNSVVEAINYNIPILSSQSGGGINEILSNGQFGILFKNDSKEDLIKKLELFIENEDLYFNKTLKAKKGLKRFLLKKCIIKYNKLFSNI